MSEELRKPRIYPRRIVERPRLIRELDSSDARIVLLVAGSGWGKTVLAEQWASVEGVAAGWFRANPSAADVAVVARGLVAAASEVLPGVGQRLLERLSATEDPEREAVLLAEMLADDLADWPATGRLVIDNYEHVAVSAASETFIERVVARSSVRVLIVGRVRPVWAHAPTMTSAAAVELREQSLGFTEDETQEVFDDKRRSVGGRRVDGWPALVGLASMVPDAPEPAVSSARALYDFYAEAWFGGLPRALRSDLTALAGLPSIDRGLATAIFGGRAHELCTQSVELGILDERDERLELHPLLREFLERKADQSADPTPQVAAVLGLYRERRDWDSAFELVRRHALDDELATLVLEAVDELLFSGRLSTIEAWVRFARARDVPPHPVFEIAEIEVQLRHGRHATALTNARSFIEVSGVTGGIQHRALMVAGRAAHAGHREDEALGYYQRAREFSQSRSQEREARSAEIMCLATLERPEAQTLLEELVASVVGSDARDQVRTADRQLGVGFHFGFIRHLAESRRAAELVDQVDDPFVRCSFLTVHAWALTLGAYYEEASEVTQRLLNNTIELRVDPVLPYAYSTHAIVCAGLGKQAEAYEAVDLADRFARRISDQNGSQNAYATRVRVLLQAGAQLEACALEPPDVGDALPYTRGEVLGTRALALASIGRVDEAAELARLARNSSRGIETQALSAAADAVCSLKQRRDDIMDLCEQLIEHVFEAGSVDFAVTAYRANPELLATLLSSRRVRDQVVYLVRRAGDEPRVKALGLSSSAAVDPATLLSHREREVYELLCAGVSNAQIARRLFIAEGTVKAHVHHVFDKLGIRSRSALALNAARTRYATSAATSAGGSSETTGEVTTPNPDPRAER